MADSDVQLSSAGAERRERILELAKRQARRRRHRRRAVRIGVVGASVVLAVFALRPTRQVSQIAVKLAPSNLPAPPARPVGVTITFIQTDLTIADRLSISPTPRWTVIDDDQLLQSLADAGHPSGLISMNGQTFLLPR